MDKNVLIRNIFLLSFVGIMVCCSVVYGCQTNYFATKPIVTCLLCRARVEGNFAVLMMNKHLFCNHFSCGLCNDGIMQPTIDALLNHYSANHASSISEALKWYNNPEYCYAFCGICNRSFYAKNTIVKQRLERHAFCCHQVCLRCNDVPQDATPEYMLQHVQEKHNEIYATACVWLKKRKTQEKLQDSVIDSLIDKINDDALRDSSAETEWKNIHELALLANVQIEETDMILPDSDGIERIDGFTLQEIKNGLKKWKE